MDFFSGLISPMPCAAEHKAEVQKLLDELIKIGQTEDFLSERPGHGFNGQCRHVRTIMIGRRLDEIGQLALMTWVHQRVRRKLKAQLASHLEYAWDGVGSYRA